MTTRLVRALVAAAVAATFGCAPVAVADPSDLTPVCTGSQTPKNSGCRTACPEGADVHSDGSCAEPGTTLQPAVP